MREIENMYISCLSLDGYYGISFRSLNEPFRKLELRSHQRRSCVPLNENLVVMQSRSHRDPNRLYNSFRFGSIGGHSGRK